MLRSEQLQKVLEFVTWAKIEAEDGNFDTDIIDRIDKFQTLLIQEKTHAEIGEALNPNQPILNHIS